MRFSRLISTERLCDICGKKRETILIRTKHTDSKFTFCKICLTLMLEGFNVPKKEKGRYTSFV